MNVSVRTGIDRRDLPAMAERCRQHGDEAVWEWILKVTHGAVERELLGIPASCASITPWPGEAKGTPGNRQLD